MKQNQLKRRGGPSPCFLFWVFLGESWTLLREVLPADNGSSLSVSWSLLRGERGGEVLHYVLEWAGVAVAEPQWKRLAGDQNNASITGTGYLPPRQSWCLCQPGWTRIYQFWRILKEFFYLALLMFFFFLGGGLLAIKPAPKTIVTQRIWCLTPSFNYLFIF